MLIFGLLGAGAAGIMITEVLRHFLTSHQSLIVIVLVWAGQDKSPGIKHTFYSMSCMATAWVK